MFCEVVITVSQKGR